MARPKRGRDIDGVVLLDKPSGCSSNHALQRVRRAFDARKAGHTGSLDPLATGLLPICLGEATKVAGYLLGADKTYRVIARVGAETATGDLEGAITEHCDQPTPGRAELAAFLASFVGRQTQIPPMYSALKHRGRPLYDYARAGIDVAREPRAIEIHAATLIDCTPTGFELELRVSGGTYVRTLVEDIARAFGGRAHVGELRRSSVGALGDSAPMIPLAEIEACAGDTARLDALVVPLATIIGDWPRIELDAAASKAISTGQRVACDAAIDTKGSLVRILDAEARTLGLGLRDANGWLVPRRLFVRPVA